jgi:hypothetical protein
VRRRKKQQFEGAEPLIPETKDLNLRIEPAPK